VSAAETKPKDPWSDEQLQSTPVGPPDRAPWTLTLVVTALLALLLLGGYFLWRSGEDSGMPAGSHLIPRPDLVEPLAATAAMTTAA
jgi:hypothetical protein